MRSRKAFTLIELLIVVAIIAILAAIAVPNFLEAQVRSKVSRAKADMRSLATALEAYAVDNNKYPVSWARQDGTAKNPTVSIAGVQGPVSTPINPRIQRLAWITTPIAYITSIQNDPFAVGTNESDPLNSEFPVFTYWDAPMTDNTKVSSAGPTRYQDMTAELASRSAWALICYGPDKDFEPAANWTGHWALYDPTNGTVSNGDVWRFGGSGIPKQ
ncbi:MAG: hypothetical protein Kow0059_11990 [Candidatus Sumerlaeia bacterium]